MNLVLVLLMIGTMGALLGSVLTWVLCLYAMKWRHIGKTYVMTIPETPGTEAPVYRARIKDGKVDLPSLNHDSERGDMDRLLPQGSVAYRATGAINGPLHIMSTYGANLVAPPKLEAAKAVEDAVVAKWVADYKRLPKTEELAEKGAFAKAMTEAFQAAKTKALNFLVWDPLAYFKACQENDMQDFLNAAGGAKDPWYAKAAFIGIVIMGGLLLLVLMVLMTKVVPALGGIAASGP